MPVKVTLSVVIPSANTTASLPQDCMTLQMRLVSARFPPVEHTMWPTRLSHMARGGRCLGLKQPYRRGRCGANTGAYALDHHRA